jgi:hypothetical protein
MRCHPLTRRERTQDHLLSISLDCRFCCTSELATNNQRAKRPPLFDIRDSSHVFLTPPKNKGYRRCAYAGHPVQYWLGALVIIGIARLLAGTAGAQPDRHPLQRMPSNRRMRAEFPQGLCCQSSWCVTMTGVKTPAAFQFLGHNASVPCLRSMFFRCTWMHIPTIIVIIPQPLLSTGQTTMRFVRVYGQETRLLCASFHCCLSPVCAVTTLTGLIFPFSACHAVAYYGCSSRVENI